MDKPVRVRPRLAGTRISQECLIAGVRHKGGMPPMGLFLPDGVVSSGPGTICGTGLQTGRLW